MQAAARHLTLLQDSAAPHSEPGRHCIMMKTDMQQLGGVKPQSAMGWNTDKKRVSWKCIVWPGCHYSPLAGSCNSTGSASTVHAFDGGGAALGSGGSAEVPDARVESLRFLRTASRRHDFHERHASETSGSMQTK